MRSLLLVACFVSLASADGKRTLPMKVVTNGQAGDWTLFESERESLDGGTIKERAIAVIAPSAGGNRVVWFRGAPDIETYWTDSLVATIGKIESEHEFKREAATCKLDVAFPCTKLSFTDDMFAKENKQDAIVVTVKLADRIRGSGVVELEVVQSGKVELRIKAIGYGSAAKRVWGIGPTKAKLEIPAEYTGLSASGGFPHSLGSDFTGLTYQPWRSGLDQLTVKGGKYAAATVVRYVKRKIHAVWACYESARTANAKLAGKVDFVFTIGETGAVATSTAKGLDPALERCAANVIKGIVFPKAPAAVEVAFTLNFDPTKPPPRR